MYEHDLLLELNKLETQITELREELSRLPPGKLCITQNKSRYKWYVTTNQKRYYLPKSEKSMAEALARKKYLTLKLNDLLSDQIFLTSFLNNHSHKYNESENLLRNPQYFDLLKPYYKLKDDRLSEWSYAHYEKNTNFQEHLIHKSLSSNLVRSKSEAMIDTALFRNKLPFRYECSLHLADTVFYPDFTILHPQTEELYYWEHFGMMDDPGYVRSVLSKLQIYLTNHIIPSINLITTYETKSSPLTIDFVEKLIQLYFH